MARASRRNICITSEFLDEYLDTKVSNVSAFLQEAALFYLEEKDNVYAKKSQIEDLDRKVEILNKNYLQTKDSLDKLVNSLFGR